MTNFTGACMCGKVSYVATAAPRFAVNCHCINCRKAGTSGHSSLMGIPRDGMTITGDLAHFSWQADSGNRLTKYFCPACGCMIYQENNARPNIYIVPTNLMDDPELFTPLAVVYAARASSWDHPPEGLPTFPEMPPAPNKKVLS